METLPSTPLKIFVISLERAVERRAHMVRLLKTLGLEAEFIPAVDGRALTAADRRQYDSRLARLNYRSEMTDTEIACYLSHYRIYERICREGLPMALILEDDIEAAPNLLQLLRELAAQPDPEWTVVRLQTQRGRVLNPPTHDRGRAVCDLPGGALYQIDTHVLGGCAYVIRREAAEIMLEYGRRISRPIDQTLDRYWENGIVPYVVRPFPVRQHPAFRSEIGVRGKAAYADERRLDAMRGRLRRAGDGLRKRAFRAAMHHPAIRDFIALALPWQAQLSLAGRTLLR
jgi:glycosyl transferase family 25